MSKIAEYLNQHISGNAFSTPRVLEAYAADRSILRIRPKVVALPASVHDVRKLVRFSNQLAAKKIDLPVTVVGSQTDITGAAIGHGVVMSTARLDKIQEIDPRQRLVRVQAGVRLGELNAALALHGLTIPIVASPEATIGGLIANYTGGAASRKYGTIFHFVEQAEIVLSSGDCIQTERLTMRGLSYKKGLTGFEGELYRKLDNLIDDYAETIEKMIDAREIDSAGYEMIARVRGRKTFDILPLLFASQGTLGAVTEVILNCDLLSEPFNYVAAVFKSAEEALGFADRALALEPRSVDLIDARILAEAAAHGKVCRVFDEAPTEGLMVYAIFDDEKVRKRRKKIAKLARAAKCVVSNEENYGHFTELESIYLGYLNNSLRGERAPLVDGARVPADKVADYFAALRVLEEKHGVALPCFGSAAAKEFTVRPAIDLGSVLGRQFVLAFLRDYSKAVEGLGGTLTGGTPEGRVKAMATNAKIDSKLLKLYAEIKNIFDPRGILNPGVKCEASLHATVRALRTSYEPGIIREN
jgi:FAD/FMN-containing dehydrogenase